LDPLQALSGLAGRVLPRNRRLRPAVKPVAKRGGRRFDVLSPGTPTHSRYPRLEPVASASIGRAQIRLDPSVQGIKPRPKPGHLQSRTGLPAFRRIDADPKVQRCKPLLPLEESVRMRSKRRGAPPAVWRTRKGAPTNWAGTP